MTKQAIEGTIFIYTDFEGFSFYEIGGERVYTEDMKVMAWIDRKTVEMEAAGQGRREQESGTFTRPIYFVKFYAA
jgi:hypothetical protein